MGNPTFVEAKDQTPIANGRVRDDSFDEAVRYAYTEKRGVKLEATVANVDEANDYINGLKRSALFLSKYDADRNTAPLNVTVSVDVKPLKDGKATVQFIAREKRTRTVRAKAASNGDGTPDSAEAPSA